ncbi:MAG: hypothetical protein WC208_10425 [Gallionella sp.]
MGKRYTLGQYNIPLIKRIGAYCKKFDVESDVHGIFLVGDDSIRIYSRPWKPDEQRGNFYLVGTVWIDWSNGNVDIEEEGPTELTRWIFNYLYDSARLGTIDKWNFRDDPYWMYKEEIEYAEPFLKTAEEKRSGR